MRIRYFKQKTPIFTCLLDAHLNILKSLSGTYMQIFSRVQVQTSLKQERLCGGSFNMAIVAYEQLMSNV